MTIKILEDLERIAMKDVNDVRSFIAGEVLKLSDANEDHLVKLGVAEPMIDPVPHVEPKPVEEPTPDHVEAETVEAAE